jgi:predicted 3-demethylubiquinone-9 3-methyltransferase (glyoxalase superfamily)
MVALDNYDLGDYGFGKKVGWCEDKYSVSSTYINLVITCRLKSI